MIFKPNVVLDVVPQIARILPTIDRVYEKVIGMECTITSARDGNHRTRKHPDGEAVDCRIRDPHRAWTTTQAERADLVAALKSALGDDYDVVLEQDPEDAHSHIHVEFDP